MNEYLKDLQKYREKSTDALPEKSLEEIPLEIIGAITVEFTG